MRSSLPSVTRIAPLIGALLALDSRPAIAHEIPNRVTVRAFVKVEAGRLRVLVRAPLEAMRDVDFPQRGPGYLDLQRAAPFAREAAHLWIAGGLTIIENGVALGDPVLIATRIALPTDRAFSSYDSALAGITGPPLATTLDVPWQQAALDVLLEYRIASPQSDFALRSSLAGLGLETNTVLRFIGTNGIERAYQFHGDPGLVRLDPRWYHAGWQFVKLGVHHILGGIDHLLFVLCLVIPFRRLRPLVVIVTAFTVAHSITLISAALGIVPGALWFPPLVETLIAASILFMALENVVFQARAGAPPANPQRRWLIAFGFGLIHGFGFSFALGESLQFAGAHLLLSLVTFNIGVEIGQLLVLVVAIPLLALLFRRVVTERVGIIILSAFIAHTAWHWTAERGAALSEYRFTWPALDILFAASALRAAMVLVIAAGAAWALSEVYKRIPAGPRATAPGEPS